MKQMLEEMGLGAVLLFETSNIRHATLTQIGHGAFNKSERWALVTKDRSCSGLGLRPRLSRRTLSCFLHVRRGELQG